MNINIICIGKLKEKYWQDAQAEYLKRLSSYADVKVVELKESRSDDIDEEGREILKALGTPASRKSAKKHDEFVITLEIAGASMSSEKLALKIAELGLEGKSNITFIIGGSNGLSPEVSAASDMKLSFSAMTFPHQMMRVILLEQIYRSFKINRGEAYHK